MTDLHLHNYDEVQSFLKWEQDMIVWKEQEEKMKSAALYDQWNNSWTLYRD
tara:strand:- start:189 stop:341 length:153 start_codon:yes stop_codon:yes gene_type:complete